MSEISVPALRNAATQLRIDSVRSTSEAGSGHPTTCLSAAEIVATLFFARDALRPEGAAESGQRSLRAVEGTRRADSLCGLGGGRPVSARRAAEAAAHRHAISKAIRRRGCRSSTSRRARSARASAPPSGTALNARRIKSDYRTYVLLGDGEMAEGSVWEAANLGAALQARQPLRESSTSTGSGRARRRSSATTWRQIAAPLEGLRLAHARRGRP